MKEIIRSILVTIVFLIFSAALALGAASIFGDIATFSNNTYFWGNSTNMPRNITAGFLYGDVNCTQIYGGSDTDFCVDASGGGGTGENFWRVEGGWMSPNITAGGDSDINATNFNATGTVNATEFFENVVALTDKYLQVTDTINWGNISNRNLNIAWTGNLLWGNISGRSLNILWTDKLSWGNLSEYNLNTAWSGTMLGGNITSGSITSSQLVANLGLGWANLTDYPSICPKDQWVKQIGDTLTCVQPNFGNITGSLLWGNLTGFNLNSAWSSYLWWGNLTGFNLNRSWNGTLGWGNISERNLNINWLGNLYYGNLSGAYAFNASYDSQLGKNTTAEIINAINLSKLLWGNLSTFDLNSAWSSKLFYNNLTVCGDAEILKISGGAWACAADATGGGSGANFWKVEGGWMSPNVTAGGDTDVNASNFNATGDINGTRIFDAGLRVLTSEAEAMYNANYSSILKSPLTLPWWNISNPTLAVSWNGTLFWNNISGRNLNIAWLGGLYYGNLTGAYSFNTSYDAKAQTGSCTNQFITATTSTAAPTCNSVTNSYLTTGIFATIQGIGVQSQTLDMGKNSITNISSLSLGLGNITSGIASVNFNMGGNSITNATWGNFTNVNATKVYVNTTCYTPDCLRNTTFNGTCVITYSTSSILEIC